MPFVNVGRCFAQRELATSLRAIMPLWTLQVDAEDRTYQTDGFCFARAYPLLGILWL